MPALLRRTLLTFLFRNPRERQRLLLALDKVRFIKSRRLLAAAKQINDARLQSFFAVLQMGYSGHVVHSVRPTAAVFWIVLELVRVGWSN